MNVSCATPACRESVIGQCSGYNDSCGRFYCANHSVGKLCLECDRKRKSDDIERVRQYELQKIYEDYVKTAGNVSKMIWSSVTWKNHPFVRFLMICALSWIFAGFIGLLLDGPTQMIAVFLGYVGCIYAIVAMFQLAKANHDRVVNRIEAQKPGFKQFYIELKRHESEERLKKFLYTAVVVTLVADEMRKNRSDK